LRSGAPGGAWVTKIQFRDGRPIIPTPELVKGP